MVGLTHAFLYAGSKSVVTTQWAVPDETSANLVINFMELLKEGHNKSHALAQAKRNYLKKADSRHAHPFYWAGYTLTGDDRPLAFEDHNFPYTLLLMLILGAFPAFILIRLRKRSR